MPAEASAPGSNAVRGGPTWVALAALLVMFCVSGPALEMVGLHYTEAGGSAVEKVHPATDLAALAAMFAAMRGGNPIRFVGRWLDRVPGAFALLAATLVVIVYFIKVQDAPFTPLIDTFILPALLLPLLVDMPAASRTLAERGLHLFLAVNAVMGMVEAAFGFRLIPVHMQGALLTIAMDWRAAAFLGHPLSSSATAGMYAVILAMGFGRAMPSWLRFPAILLQVTSLGAFGGRIALVLTVICLGGIGAWQALALLRGRRFDRRVGAAALLLGLACAGVGVALISYGYFDRLIERFVNDNGSAESRVLILEVMRRFTWQELWLGPNQDHLASLLHLEGIEIGIESFWLGFIGLCGLWMSGIFFLVFGAFLLEVLRWTDRLALVPIGFFTVIISTSLSLSAKSLWLGQLVAILVLLMPRQPRKVSRPAVSHPFGRGVRAWAPQRETGAV